MVVLDGKMLGWLFLATNDCVCLPISEVEKPVGAKLVNTVKLISEFFLSELMVKGIRVV